MNASIDSDRHVDGRVGGCLTALLVVIAALASAGRVGAQEDMPVASFEAAAVEDAAADKPPPAAADPAKGKNGAAQEPVLSFSFRFAPWENVLHKFADVADLTLDLTDVPPGTFNYHDKGRYTPLEALDVLNGYLLQRGFVLVRRDRFLVCVDFKKGIPANLIPLVTLDQLPELGKNELVSVIFPRLEIDASLAASQIAQLQGPHGKVVSLNATNSLLVTDTGGNLRLIRRLLDQGAFSRPANGTTGAAFKSFDLRFVRADEAERLIRTLFGMPPATSSAKGVAAASGTTDLSITTDARTNRLFVTATSAKLASIEQIIAAFDVADAAADRPLQRGTTTTRILPLPNSDVIVVGQALESLSPRIRVSTTRSPRGSAAAAATAPATPPAGNAADQEVERPAGGARPPVETPPSTDGRDR